MLVKDFKYPLLMKYFEEISAIPRKSYHEEKIADYIVAFANERGIEVYRDESHNVLINIPATKGMENCAPVLLQGHTDMVCEKNIGTEHDFLRDGLDLYVEDGKIRARGTTLGADNGVAVAVMLALLDGATDKHPALQCLFTSAEEVGMGGVENFDFSKIYAKNMLNMDSADDSEIIAGCAGGVRSDIKLPIGRKTVGNKAIFEIKLGGLAGGHSGEDINRGRLNANKLLAAVLQSLMTNGSVGLDLISFIGGTASNAIPREAIATVCIDPSCEGALRDGVAEMSKTLCATIGADDANFFVDVKRLDGDTANIINRDDAKKLVFLVLAVPYGPLAYNRDMPGVVEYSRNIGIVNCTETEASVSFFARSAFSERLDLSCLELDAYADIIGAKHLCDSRYPGWVYVPVSKLRDQYADIIEQVLGKKPEITVIHAGLECGIISAAIPDIDIISIGAIVRNLHSPDEYLDVASFERFFTMVCKFLANWN